MKLKIFYCALVAFAIAVQGCYSQTSPSKKNTVMNNPDQKKNAVYSNTDTTKVALADEEWKKMLSPEVYNVARQKGTERPYTSAFEHSKEIGTYYCAVCGNALFKSDTKWRLVLLKEM